MNELVSIIIPVYNAENSLVRCLDSVISQTYADVEIIVLNDGSSDNSQKICEEYKEKDNRIKFINQENQGVSKTRNTAINIANGKYVLFIDSDDTISIDYVETLVTEAVNTGADLVICGYENVYDLKKETITYGSDLLYSFETFDVFDKLSEKMLLATPWGKLFVKDKIQSYFREDISLGEDVCFVLNYLKNIGVVKIVDKALYQYFISTNAQSLSKKYHSNLCGVVVAVDTAKKELFDRKYNGNEEATLFRRNSLIGDVLLMLSKLSKAKRVSYAVIKKDSKDLFDYLKSEISIKDWKNTKLLIYYVFYKMHLLWTLRLL